MLMYENWPLKIDFYFDTKEFLCINFDFKNEFKLKNDNEKLLYDRTAAMPPV